MREGALFPKGIYLFICCINSYLQIINAKHELPAGRDVFAEGSCYRYMMPVMAQPVNRTVKREQLSIVIHLIGSQEGDLLQIRLAMETAFICPYINKCADAQ